MSKHTDTPSSGYYVEVDLAGDVTSVQKLRTELKNTGIHVAVLDMHGPGGGNPNVRLHSMSRLRLRDWLTANQYELDVHPVIDARNPDSVPHA
jgi:hypothetical protein